MQHGHCVIPVHASDVIHTDFLRASRFALVLIRAIPKPFGIHLTYHRQYPLVLLRLALRQVTEMGNFCGNEQHGR